MDKDKNMQLKVLELAFTGNVISKKNFSIRKTKGKTENVQFPNYLSWTWLPLYLMK